MAKDRFIVKLFTRASVLTMTMWGDIAVIGVPASGGMLRVGDMILIQNPREALPGVYQVESINEAVNMGLVIGAKRHAKG